MAYLRRLASGRLAAMTARPSAWILITARRSAAAIHSASRFMRSASARWRIHSRDLTALRASLTRAALLMRVAAALVRAFMRRSDSSEDAKLRAAATSASAAMSFSASAFARFVATVSSVRRTCAMAFLVRHPRAHAWSRIAESSHSMWSSCSAADITVPSSPSPLPTERTPPDIGRRVPASPAPRPNVPDMPLLLVSSTSSTRPTEPESIDDPTPRLVLDRKHCVGAPLKCARRRSSGFPTPDFPMAVGGGHSITKPGCAAGWRKNHDPSLGMTFQQCRSGSNGALKCTSGVRFA
mmetsp:Transcript_40972/g.126506  ORF Transcript_40972/g.126506 Transcript_40972/m.126506 type:complete len:296 (-) Transcript_40972:80-967(-)